MFIQNDPKWKDYEIVKGVPIGVYGCLLTSICNILVQLGQVYTPQTLAETLKNYNGFDGQGNLQWNVLQERFNISMKKYMPYESINWSDDKNINFITQLHYRDTGHFCNIISVNNGIITYFNVYSGKTEFIKQIETISIRELTTK